jgi:phosphoribosylanthranilate isomerase
MTPLVKVCGLTLPEQAAALDEMGLDLLGFIFAAKSPRLVTPEQAAAMPFSRARRVGVFVEQSAEEVRRIMDLARLDLAQLHGGQDQEFCRKVGPQRVIRAFWPQRFADRGELEAELAQYADSCAYFLLDSGTSGGGHGRGLDFAGLAGLNSPRPWLLAGGLGPDNLAEATCLATPDGFDLNSGVESSPGVKDLEKIKMSLQLIKNTKSS